MKAVDVITHVGAITALEIVQDYILSGEGPYLHVYSIKDRTQIGECNVLQWCTIHGFKKGPGTLFAVYGQKSISVVDVNCQTRHIRAVREPSELEDWIKAVRWLQDGEQLAIALAHNSVALLDWKKSEVIEHVHCEDKCILYSACILSNTWESLVLAVGTVFNQVVLWKSSGLKNEDGRVIVDKRLRGHEGVIFSISYSGKHGMLCSVSDDRSIRVWELKDLESLSLTLSTPLLVLYGHTARVWDAAFMDNYIVSIGEDATCCVWDYHGNNLKKFKGHKGSSIWSLATSEEHQIVVTGGGDCSIRVWSMVAWQQEGIKTTQLDPPSSDPMDYPRLVDVISSGQVLILTNKGVFYSYHIAEKEWTVLQNDNKYGSYALLSVSPNHKIVAMANITGFLRVLLIGDISKFDEVKVYDGKVLSLCWASNEDIFTSGPEGTVVWWKVQLSENSVVLHKCQCFSLPYARQRWVTAVVVLSDDKHVVMGDRRGTVHLYESSQDVRNEPLPPTQSLVTIHGKGGVTDACRHGDYIYTSGRDSTYKQYSYHDNNLQLLNASKVYKGFEWLEKLTYTDDGDLQICGFHTSSFVVWSVDRNEKLLQVECGGGHRSYGFAANVQNTAVFVYVKSRSVMLCQTTMETLHSQTIIKDSVHWKEIPCICYLDTVYDITSPDTQHHIIVTGSEDTKINIIAITKNGGRTQQKVLKSLHSHISSVRTLQACVLPSSGGTQPMEFTKVLFSAGGRAALKCWKISAKLTNKRVKEITRFPECSVEMLGCHGTSDGRSKRRPKWQRDDDIEDNDTRYMSMSAWKGRQDTVYYVAIVSSDVVLRLFSFDLVMKKFMVLAESSWHDHCILVTKHITLNSTPLNVGDTDVPTMLFTGATDGRVACWDIMPTIKEHGKFLIERDMEVKSSSEEEDDDSVRNVTMETKEMSLIGSEERVVKLHDGNTTGSESEIQQSELVVGRTESNTEFQECGEAESIEPDLVVTSLKLYDRRTNCYSHVALNKIKLSDPICVLNTHQSGINSLAIQHYQGNDYLVATGGDDNALCVTLVELHAENATHSITVKDQYSIPSAHAAQITGAHWMDSTTLVTVSIDQRLNVWTVEVKERQITSITFIYSKFVHVADVACMESWKDRNGMPYFLLSGVGLQLLSGQR
ncbi:tRNA (34-2'-O)-methyltransferase regulator WDR6-like isoform X2 [Glandiceps talaboti]